MKLCNSQIDLSVVAASRNDDHGGNLRSRMQIFVEGLAAQANKHRLPVELILVEWNPPADRPPLAEALRWPQRSPFFSARIVTVPHEFHDNFDHAQNLPFFQMIAKNVGVRRAKAPFVLATNIDILFSDAAFCHFKNLRPEHLYRCDRYDVPSELATADVGEVLPLCARLAFRVNRRGNTLVKVGGKWRVEGRSTLLAACRAHLARYAKMACRAALGVKSYLIRFFRAAPFLLAHALSHFSFVKLNDRPLFDMPRYIFQIFARMTLTWLRPVTHRTVNRMTTWIAGVRRHRRDRRLHTNACGDFTLMAREDWFRLRGYPEWPIFSWHIDSVILHQARANGIREVDWPTHAHVYHIEHGHGSGYTPEGADKLFSRLKMAGVPYLSWPDFRDLADKMYKAGRRGEAVIFNGADWGLAGIDLPEVMIGSKVDRDETSSRTLEGARA
jgi:hypothetical protein